MVKIWYEIAGKRYTEVINASYGSAYESDDPEVKYLICKREDGRVVSIEANEEKIIHTDIPENAKIIIKIEDFYLYLNKKKSEILGIGLSGGEIYKEEINICRLSTEVLNEDVVWQGKDILWYTRNIIIIVRIDTIYLFRKKGKLIELYTIEDNEDIFYSVRVRKNKQIIIEIRGYDDCPKEYIFSLDGIKLVKQYIPE